MQQMTAKTLELLSEQLRFETLACKKSQVYSEYFQDPALKTLCTDVAQHHRQHFDALTQYLNKH